jgi:transcriptional repressor NrdR
VAYLRFASVYRSFDSLGDFEREIAALRAESRRDKDDPPETRPTNGRHPETAGTGVHTE